MLTLRAPLARRCHGQRRGAGRCRTRLAHGAGGGGGLWRRHQQPLHEADPRRCALPGEGGDAGALFAALAARATRDVLTRAPPAEPQLDYGQLRLVFDALHERLHMLRAAPHLTRPIPTMMPCYKLWEVRPRGAARRMAHGACSSVERRRTRARCRTSGQGSKRTTRWRGARRSPGRTSPRPPRRASCFPRCWLSGQTATR